VPENPAQLSEEEKARIRAHLGYPQTNPVTDIQLGVPALTQTAFLLEGAMTRVPESRMVICRKYLGILDDLEMQLVEAQRRLRAKKVGDIELNPEECQQLEIEYIRWVDRMADFFACTKNPYSPRWGGGKQPLNVRVVHGC
jgi:hypothetical protein